MTSRGPAGRTQASNARTTAPACTRYRHGGRQFQRVGDDLRRINSFCQHVMQEPTCQHAFYKPMHCICPSTSVHQPKNRANGDACAKLLISSPATSLIELWSALVSTITFLIDPTHPAVGTLAHLQHSLRERSTLHGWHATCNPASVPPRRESNAILTHSMREAAPTPAKSFTAHARLVNSLGRLLLAAALRASKASRRRCAAARRQHLRGAVQHPAVPVQNVKLAVARCNMSLHVCTCLAQ